MDILSKAVNICEDRQAEDINIYDVRENSILADYYIICSVNSVAHIRALTNKITSSLKECGILLRHIEGNPSSLWVIMDYRDLLIHVFHPETRLFYDIESLLKKTSRKVFVEKSPHPI